MKFLLLLATISPVMGQSITTTNIFTKTESQVLDGPIDLDKIKLKEAHVNVFDIYDNGFDQKAFLGLVLSAIKESNPGVDGIAEFYKSVKLHTDLWDIEGMGTKYPSLGETKKEHITFFYMGDDNAFEGELVSDVSVTNQDNVTSSNIKDIFTVTELGTINNTTAEQVISKLFDVNKDNGVLTEDLSVEYIDYGSAKIKANGAHDLTGEVDVTFSSSYTDDMIWKSDVVSVSVYNSSDSAEEHKLLTIKPTLGREKFEAYFSKVNFTGSGYRSGNYWGKHEFTTNDGGFTDPTLPIIYDSETKHKGVLRINQETDNVVTYASSHKNVNEESVNTQVTSTWNSNGELELLFSVSVYGYASWVNAEYAEPEIQMEYSNVVFERA